MSTTESIASAGKSTRSGWPYDATPGFLARLLNPRPGRHHVDPARADEQKLALHLVDGTGWMR